MSIDMYVSSSKSQSASVSQMAKQQIRSYEKLQTAISDFSLNSPFLSGEAYNSAKAYFSSVLYPLAQGGILLSEAVEQAVKKFPEDYVSDVDSGDLKQSELEEKIRQADSLIAQAESFGQQLRSTKTPDIIKLFQLSANAVMIGIYGNAKRELEEKLHKLMQFNSSSPNIFAEIANLQLAVNQGVAQTKTAFNARTGKFDLPPAEALGWAKTISSLWSEKNSLEVAALIDGKEFRIGSPEKPIVDFDNDFPYDSALEATWEDRKNRAEWEAKLRGAQLLGHLPDGTAIYSHYLYGNGKRYTVDFEKGYRQDSVIKMNVDAEIRRIQQAAEEYYKKTRKTDFSLTGAASGTEGYPVTENWQKALGGFQIWSSADVRVVNGNFEIDVKVYAIDRYNFNKNQQDIKTGTLDEVNGRFESLGWAHSFDVSGEIEKKVSWNQGDVGKSTIPEGSKPRIGEGENR